MLHESKVQSNTSCASLEVECTECASRCMIGRAPRLISLDDVVFTDSHLIHWDISIRFIIGLCMAMAMSSNNCSHMAIGLMTVFPTKLTERASISEVFGSR